ncbi:unnamed protein product, partial [Brassica oleracea]
VCVKPLLLSSHSLETLSRYIPTGVHFHLFHHKEEDYAGTSLPRRSRANAIEQHKTCFTQFKTSQLSSVAARTQAHILSKTFSSSLFSRNCLGILIFVCEFELVVLAGTVLIGITSILAPVNFVTASAYVLSASDAFSATSF